MDLTDRIFRFLGRFNYPVSSHSFALFRILFCLQQLLIIQEVYHYRALIFDAVPDVSKNVFPAPLFIFIWAVSCLMLLSGLLTKYAAVVNYVCCVLSASLFANSNVATFNDDLLRIGSFLCIFMPVSKSFSLDALRHSVISGRIDPRRTSYLNYLLFIFLSLGLLYFPSGLTKTYSTVWMNGLGLWIPCSIPYNKWNSIPELFINQQWFVYAMNYGTIIFELVFIFLLFVPKLHPWIAVTGILMHAGIALLFPFPKVAIGPIMFYSLFLTDGFWSKLSALVKTGATTKVLVDEKNIYSVIAWRFLKATDVRKRFIISEDGIAINTWKNFDRLMSSYFILSPLRIIFRTGLFRILARIAVKEWFTLGTIPESRPGLTTRFRQTLLIYFCIGCALVQLVISGYHLYNYFNAGAEKRLAYHMRRKAGVDVSMKPGNFPRTFLGINSRGLFLDHANTGSKTTYAITYFNNKGEECWLPMFTERGYVRGEMNMNVSWPKVTFNLISFSTNPADSAGLKKITKFWADKYHVQLDSLQMMVYRKTYDYPKAFEKDYYLKLEALPWEKEGAISWNKKVFSYKSFR